MISRRLWHSKKAASLSDRSFGIYVLCVVNTNVHGRLEADGISLLAAAAVRGIAQGWTAESMEAAADDLGSAGLLKLWTVDGQRYAEVVNFSDHNKVRDLREAPDLIPPPPGELPEPAGSPPGGLRSRSRECECECEKECECEAAPECPIPHDTSDDRTNGKETWSYRAERLRILRACQVVGEEGGVPWAPNLTVESAIHKYADNGKCREWPTEEELIIELRRVRAGAVAKGLRQAEDVGWILRNVGSLWNAPTAPGASPTPELEADARRSEIEKAKTQALIASMTEGMTPAEVDAAHRRGPPSAKPRDLARKVMSACAPPGRTISPPADPEPVREGERKLGPLAGAATAFLEKLEARAEKACERVAEDAAGAVPIDPVERMVRDLARRAAP